MTFAIAETVARAALMALGVSSVACEMVAKAPGGGRAASEGMRAINEERTPETRKKAPITPALVAASQRLLEEHHEAPSEANFPSW